MTQLLDFDNCSGRVFPCPYCHINRDYTLSCVNAVDFGAAKYDGSGMLQAERRMAKAGHPTDMVNHPTHYNQGGYEAADIIEAFGLPYHVGTVVKYALRFQFKGERLTDLRKAAWHLARQIKLEEVDDVGNMS